MFQLKSDGKSEFLSNFDNTFTLHEDLNAFSDISVKNE
jgi:hypothetical protein